MAAADAPPCEFVVHDPVDGEEISRHAGIGAHQLREIIRRARTAQPGWASLPLKTRVRHVAAMREWLVEHADEVATTVSRCTGKTPTEALAADVMPAVFANAWYCGKARSFLSTQRIPSGTLLLANKRSRLHRKPLGVVGVISPWNYPLGIPAHEVLPALLAGNTVVFKTAPQTIPVGAVFEDMCRAAGLPDDVFHHVVIDGPVCGDVMLEETGVDKLFFTGSVPVGRLLAEKAAKHLVPVSLELGGKDPMIVLDDADLERAARGAVWGGMQNAGQACAAVERVYVQRAVYEPFLAHVKAQVEALRANGPRRADSDVGVLTTDRQVETVKAHLDDALQRGARVFVQGKSGITSTRLVPPTVLVDVNHDMRVMHEETFGPVIGVMPFDTDDDAVALANDSRYGLTASVWSRNAQRAASIATKIEAGAITVNDHLMSHAMTETPWGGVKESGNGRGHGRVAFDAVTETQVVIQDRLAFLPRNLWWHPYTETGHRGLRGAIVAAHGHGFRRRLRAAMDLVRAFLAALRRD